VTAYKLPRGRCPWCGKTRALDLRGKVRRHLDPSRPEPGAVCPGSGQRPTAGAASRGPAALRNVSGPGMIRRPPPP
jgi:hypothetical protein